IAGIYVNDEPCHVKAATHRRNTDEEIERMIGREFARSCRVICHDARGTASLVPVGDANGVRVLLNREWIASDFKITTGFVEPHFFAGFSGGPKMVAPGLAGGATPMTLHHAAPRRATEGPKGGHSSTAHNERVPRRDPS